MSTGQEYARIALFVDISRLTNGITCLGYGPEEGVPSEMVAKANGVKQIATINEDIKALKFFIGFPI